MSEVIKFHDVSKVYRLGTGQHDLREAVAGLARRILQLRRTQNGTAEFLALKDVSFALQQGTALGIIGSNGAGKTTILKILSRVTKPTSGTVSVNGRMSSLIELGAGFHPDLTGKENIYLNGTILGLKRREIDALLERITEFSELQQFIDTPVKRYSSGMYARLGFAVAAHVNPEILLVDEVLSVGDLSFQMKCAERMKELRAQGTAIIFVSHNMRAVDSICDSCLLLEHGQVRFLGPTTEAINVHSKLNRPETVTGIDGEVPTVQPEPGKLADITKVELLDEQGNPRDHYEIGETLVARIHYVAYQRIEAPFFSAGFFRADGLHACSNTSRGYLEPDAIDGPGVVELTVPDLPLVPNTYVLVTSICERRSLRAYAMEQLASFHVGSSDVLIDEAYGVFLPDFRWQAVPSNPSSAVSCDANQERRSIDQCLT